MKISSAVLWLFFAGCGSITSASGALETRVTPSPGAKPAVKKELPWLTVPGGRMKTTLFYGPWQCRQQFVDQCQTQCIKEGYPFKGCMWLADLKFDWEGELILLPIPVEAGSRYGIYHCCCNYPPLLPAKKAMERKRWDRVRKSFREEWSERFGEWPEEKGKPFPTHHVRDLQHGGDPIDPSNMFPAQPDRHDVYTEQYPACHEGQDPWNAAGADLPYTDN